jgi:hypothetical protein
MQAEPACGMDGLRLNSKMALAWGLQTLSKI